MFLPTTFQECAGNGLPSDLLHCVAEISPSFWRRQSKNATHRRELIISKNGPSNYFSLITHHSRSLTSCMRTLLVIFGCFAHQILLFYNFTCPPRRNQALRLKRMWDRLLQ